MIIDFHTHCFADSIVEKAMYTLTKDNDLQIYADGSLSGLKNSMKKANVDISVVQPIATKATQTQLINDWIISIKSSEIIPFGTIHPEYEFWEKEINRLFKNGIKGIKFHPDYQNFWVDDKKMYPTYEKIADLGLITMFHCGRDISYPYQTRCTPNRLINVINDIPNLIVVGAHMGGHKMFEDVEKYLCGKNLYLDTSFAQYILGNTAMANLIKKHGVEKVLFASDSPWADVEKDINDIEKLDLTADAKDMIFSKNAYKLLKKSSPQIIRA